MTIYLRFWEACEKGEVKNVLDLIDKIDDIDKPGPQGWNGIILSAFNHHIEVVKLLLDRGANVNSTNMNGTTVFMYAKTKVIQNDNYYFLDLLIDNGADINIRDKKNNMSVLDYAKEMKNDKLINYLTTKGAK